MNRMLKNPLSLRRTRLVDAVVIPTSCCIRRTGVRFLSVHPRKYDRISLETNRLSAERLRRRRFDKGAFRSLSFLFRHDQHRYSGTGLGQFYSLSSLSSSFCSSYEQRKIASDNVRLHSEATGARRVPRLVQLCLCGANSFGRSGL
jgi:hypothetical protein